MKLKHIKLFLICLEICTIGIILIVVGAIIKSFFSFRIYLEESINVNYKMYTEQIQNIIRGE